MARPDLPPVSALVLKAGYELGMSQTALGDLVVASRKTVGRWQAGRARPSDDQLHVLARAVHPGNPALAAQLAATTLTTLAELGIAEPAPVKPAPSARLLGRVLVWTAAEVLEASPSAMRPALRAAFQAAKDLGFTVEDVLGALAEEAPAVAPPTAKARRPPQ